jgi:hypothetical protein
LFIGPSVDLAPQLGRKPDGSHGILTRSRPSWSFPYYVFL